MKQPTLTFVRSIPVLVAIGMCCSCASVHSAWAAHQETSQQYPGYDGMPSRDAAKYKVTVDPALPDYTPSRQFKGVLFSEGSETFGGAMRNLFVEFQKYQPGVRTRNEKSEWPLAALNIGSGYANLMPVVRELNDAEEEPFKEKYAREPFGIRMSKTMWNEPARTHPYGIFVNKENPLNAITVEQAAWAFFKHYPGSSPTSQPLTRWGQLGLPDVWKTRPIHSYGDLTQHALAENFKHIMSSLVGFQLQWREGDPYQGGGYVGEVDENYVAMMCREDVDAICWTGVPIGQAAGLKLLAMPTMDGDGWSSCSLQDYVDGKWPLTRYTYMYVNNRPRKGIDPLVKEFLTFMLSKQGQRAILDAGYLPLTAEEAKAELAKIQ